MSRATVSLHRTAKLRFHSDFVCEHVQYVSRLIMIITSASGTRINLEKIAEQLSRRSLFPETPRRQRRTNFQIPTWRDSETHPGINTLQRASAEDCQSPVCYLFTTQGGCYKTRTNLIIFMMRTARHARKNDRLVTAPSSEAEI